MERSTPEQLLREYGEHARLTVYVAAAPGAGKTRRLLSDARRLQTAGKRVAIGWIETKSRPDLERLSTGIPRIPPRIVEIGGQRFSDFDLDTALAAKPDTIVIDELAHDNLAGSSNAKRWQDALALRDAGISVIGAFNIAHLETVSATAEGLLGYPIREIIPFSFLKSADEVIAIDASPDLLRARLRDGKIVRTEDIERAESGAFKEGTLVLLRELLLRTIDELTLPIVSPASASTAVAIVPGDIDPHLFLERSAPIAAAFDLALEILPSTELETRRISREAQEHNAEILPAQALDRIDLSGNACLDGRAAERQTRTQARQPARRSRHLHRRRGAVVYRAHGDDDTALGHAGRPHARRLRKAHRLSRRGGRRRKNVRNAGSRRAAAGRRRRRDDRPGRNAQAGRNRSDDRRSADGSAQDAGR